MSQRYAWTHKTTDDIWQGGLCDSIEECIEEALLCGYEVGQTIAVGLAEPYKVTYVCADRIIEDLQEEAYDEVGEVSDGWLDSVTKEQRESLCEKLLKAVLEWLKECGEEPSFYKVHPIAEPVIIKKEKGDTENV